MLFSKGLRRLSRRLPLTRLHLPHHSPVGASGKPFLVPVSATPDAASLSCDREGRDMGHSTRARCGAKSKPTFPLRLHTGAAAPATDSPYSMD
jgi:hypothetical protein